MGLTSALSAIRRLISAKLMPSAVANSACSTSFCGKNSCNGGSNKRIVHGRSSANEKICLKSVIWRAFSAANATWRSASSVAKIIWRILKIRSGPKNMCSVRTSPNPCAPNSKAVATSCGVSALAQTANGAISSHQLSTVPSVVS